MTAPTTNLRRHPRIQVDVQANVVTKDGRKLLARTRDLSRSGICFITTEALPSGESLRIELVLLLGHSSSSEPLPLRARVVWCTVIAGAFQVGAMFEELSGRESKFLDMFMRYLDGSILPTGVEMESVDVDEASSNSETDTAPASPDETDDPFRR